MTSLPTLPEELSPRVCVPILGQSKVKLHYNPLRYRRGNNVAFRFQGRTHWFARGGSFYTDQDLQRMDFFEGKVQMGNERVPILFIRGTDSTMLRGLLEEILEGLDFRAMLNMSDFTDTSIGTTFYQSLRWGPECLVIHRSSQIVMARVLGKAENVDSSWHTPEGRWVSSEFEYMAREP